MSKGQYKSELVNSILERDGDSELRARLKDKYRDMLNDLGSHIRPDIPIVHIDPDKLRNSYYKPKDFSPKWLGGTPERIDSGVPSRAVIAHELGHANSMGKSRLRQLSRIALASLAGVTAAGAYPVLRATTKLSKEQALATSLLATAGTAALSQWNIINEESRASKNALDYLRSYNKTLKRADRVDLDKAKDALDFAKSTYTKNVVPEQLLLAAMPALSYSIDKYINR